MEVEKKMWKELGNIVEIIWMMELWQSKHGNSAEDGNGLKNT